MRIYIYIYIYIYMNILAMQEPWGEATGGATIVDRAAYDMMLYHLSLHDIIL